jgi:hypothetical protein
MWGQECSSAPESNEVLEMKACGPDTGMEVVTKAGDAKAKVKHAILMKAETGRKQNGF